MHFSIRKRVLLVFIALVMLCVIVSNVFLYTSIRKTERNKTEEVYKSECVNLVTNLDDLFYTIQKCGNYVRYDETVAKCLNSHLTDEYDYYTSVKMLLSRYKSIYNMILMEKEYVFENAFFLNESLPIAQGVLDFENYGITGELFSNDLYTTESIKQEEWYRKTIEANGDLLIRYNKDDNKVYVSQAIRNGDIKTDKGNYVGVSLISFDIKNILNKFDVSNEDIGIAVDFGNDTVAVVSGDRNSDEFYDNQHQITIFDTNYGVRVHLLIERLGFDIWAIIILLIPEILLVSIVGFLLSFLLSRYITEPIVKLSNTISNVMEEPVISLKNRCDEIGTLYDAYHKMRASIKEYAHKLQMEERERVDLEFKLYQYRISPHMLYNTLDTISWEALTSGNSKIVEMNTMLADLYRSIISHDNFMATIREEIGFVTKYVKLQQLRYEKEIKFEVICDEENFEKLIPQCVIQPFVENSIIHNSNDIERLNIQIKVDNYDNGLKIVIEDSGTGKEVEDLMSGKGYGLGITNVIKRIKLKYSEDSDIQFKKSELGGLKVVIQLYYINEEKEEV